MALRFKYKNPLYKNIVKDIYVKNIYLLFQIVNPSRHRSVSKTSFITVLIIYYTLTCNRLHSLTTKDLRTKRPKFINFGSVITERIYYEDRFLR